MQRTTVLLTNIRRIIKLYDSMLRPICTRYELTAIEATIISFLYNNPGKDTAADIAELRMLSKSNISQADVYKRQIRLSRRRRAIIPHCDAGAAFKGHFFRLYPEGFRLLAIRKSFRLYLQLTVGRRCLRRIQCYTVNSNRFF